MHLGKKPRLNAYSIYSDPIAARVIDRSLPLHGDLLAQVEAQLAACVVGSYRDFVLVRLV